MQRQPDPLYSTSFIFLNDGDSSGNEFLKKGEEKCGLLFISPIKHESFQAVVGQRPRYFANLNLLLFTVSFVAIVSAQSPYRLKTLRPPLF